jgi:hypothetical protein
MRQRYSIAEPTVSKMKSTERDSMTFLGSDFFHAGKVITTVSTTKVEKVKELLGEGTVDESKDSKAEILHCRTNCVEDEVH